MASEIPLKCVCGSVAGTAQDTSGVTRIVCMCRWCQAYARFLVRPELLDPHGGTNIYQLTPSQVRITRGADQLRCVRLSAKGAMRWHTACCRTPVGNTLDTAWVPWVGVPHLFLDHGPGGLTPDTAFGPVRYRIHARDALTPVEGAHPTGPASLVVRTLFGALADVARGRQRPSPFFDPHTGKPVVTPTVLSSEERAALGLTPRRR